MRILSELTTWADGIRLADLLDILVVTVFAYTLISWVRRARSRFVLLGLGGLVAIYFLAQALSMYLTLFLFQVGLTIALLALVVIFQEDIRRAFERLSSGQWLKRVRRAPAPALFDTAEVVCSAVAALAQRRVGALLVFRGREPLARHLTGGVTLDGKLSGPLLDSIFDPHSAGHDGALIIENGLASSFGAHLPLASNPRGAAQQGTRHSAGLGLSERSDAFVVIVSEERGTITVARSGELEVVSSSELGARLQQFFEQLRPPSAKQGLREELAHNWGAKVIALGLAIGAWTLVHGQQSSTMERSVSVPVALSDIPKDLWVDEPQHQIVSVTLRGASGALGHWDPSGMTLTLSGEQLKPGTNRIRVSASQLDLVHGVELLSADPATLVLVAHELARLELPITPKLTGHLPPGRRLIAADAEPPKVAVEVRKQDRRRFGSVSTTPVELQRASTSITVATGLDLPPAMRLQGPGPARVQVSLRVAPTRTMGPAGH